MKTKKQKIYLVQIGLKKGLFDAFGQDVLNSIRELGIQGIEMVHVYDVYKVYGDVNLELVKRIARALLFDPVAHEMKVGRYQHDERKSILPYVEVWYRQAVTDPVALTAKNGIRDLGIAVDIDISCGKKYEFHARKIDRETVETIATKILANTLIQEFIIKGI
ncbi:MAG: phosphoribosylformylglycinamidine synthase subunit PurS [Candidatus Omnitrophica bacterium]|nr:phosphoribosylformylglycinamidine synthase subunit PurS [Candidatus Omnitrophota bacterium]